MPNALEKQGKGNGNITPPKVHYSIQLLRSSANASGARPHCILTLFGSPNRRVCDSSRCTPFIQIAPFGRNFAYPPAVIRNREQKAKYFI